MSNTKKQVIYVATDEELKDPVYYRRLWLATRNVPIPRREWLDAIADAVRDFEGDLLTRENRRYNMPCVDKTFGDDPDMRWMGHFMESTMNSDMPMHKSRIVERLRLIDLYFRIKCPDLTSRFLG